MRSYREELWFNVPGRRGFVNITPQVEECVQESGVKEGLCLVNAMHITASVYINDNESGLLSDHEKWLEGPAHQVAAVGQKEVARAKEPEGLGFQSWGALHLACAESAGADVFLTTDDQLLCLASGHAEHLHLRAENPVTWVREVAQ